MGTTEAQKRANARYRKHAVKNMQVCFYPKEYELYKFLESKDNKSGYVKQLIRQAMNNAIDSGEFKPPAEE